MGRYELLTSKTSSKVPDGRANTGKSPKSVKDRSVP